MIAGPYRAGTSDPRQWHDNLLALNDAAYAVFSRGHVPIVGANIARRNEIGTEGGPP